MNRNVRVYSADETSLTIAGLPIDSGFADGEYVTIEPAADDFTDKAGADGEVSRAKTNDRRATIKVKLQQTSAGHALLGQLRQLDIDNPNGAGVGAFQLRDRAGSLLAHAEHAWVMKPPSPGFGREISEWEWTLRAAHMDLDFQGSPALP